MMQNIIKYPLRSWLVFSLVFLNHAIAQRTTDKQIVLKELAKLREKYTDVKGLSIDVGYFYSNEGSPGKYIDSVKGNLMISGEKYKMLMDSTETIVNNKYAVMLFRQDKLMYISKKTDSRTGPNMLVMFDSLLLNAGDATFTLSEDAKENFINISFAGEDAPYKRLSFYIDRESGYITKMTSVLRTLFMAQYADEEQLAKDGYDKYAVITTLFSSHSIKEFPNDFFDEGVYFNRQGKQFVATEMYNDYKIFLGSNNL